MENNLKLEIKTIELKELSRVISSNIEAVGYQDNTTYVQFKNGSVYAYPDTDKTEYEELVKAESVGSHFSKTFRGKQDYSKLESTVLRAKKLNADEVAELIVQKMNSIINSSDETKLQFAKRVIGIVKDNLG
jgi:hypothetical protein